MGRKRPSQACFRVGKVSGYLHHGAWWLYDGKPVRRKVAINRDDAERLAAQINGQAAAGTPTLLSFEPISVAELRKQFLEYHELAVKSSMGTVHRYRAATKHLEDFVDQQSRAPQAHQVRPGRFATYLRKIEFAPNGHKNATKRKLRDKGVQFILETCRSMYMFALKNRHLAPYTGNPFSELPLDRLKIEDAKPIFVFTADFELAFFKSATDWAFPIHFVLSKTGLRVGELIHLLIEEVDIEGSWLYVRNKTELGWRVKTGNERPVPLLPEVVAVLRAVIGGRTSGPVFLRERLVGRALTLVGSRRDLERTCHQRQKEAQVDGQSLGRTQLQRIAQSVWWDAGMVRADSVRKSFVRTTAAIGHPEATCPKSWRHSFATLLQDANVDPLIRQQTLGHKPSNGNGLGMTANYTHTRGETLREQIEQALRRWPESLRYALERIKSGGFVR
ncbi:MAG: tyrosine-type recombinase/integrase [Planctomycetia bacterium]|nr:tyrosine-type recombinase/integrase [Planctomycetia bacterium]